MQHQHIIAAEELRAFKMVAETASFTRAAAMLGTAQSSVSQQIARLEKRAGRSLIRRTTRRVDLTPAGAAMLVYARSILSVADDARRQLSIPPLQGILRVGIADEFASTMLAEVLGIFQKQHPRFEMRFLTGRNDYLFESLEAKEVDIVLGKCLSGRKRGELLWRERLMWIGQPWAIESPNAPVSLITYHRPSETRDVTEAALLATRRPWTVVAECANLLGILAVAKAGLGVTALGRKFGPLDLTEIPASAGLPPLGTLDYVLERRVECSDLATDAFVEVLRSFTKHLAQEETSSLTQT